MKKQSDINQLIRQLEPKRKIIETRLKNVLTRHGKLREKDIGVLHEKYTFLYECFGKKRIERILHEFFANLLENQKLYPVGRNILKQIFKQCGLPAPGKHVLINTEVAVENLRIDLLIEDCSSGNQIAIELKTKSTFNVMQQNAYLEWQANNGSTKRKVMVICLGHNFHKIDMMVNKKFYVNTWKYFSNLICDELTKHNKDLNKDTVDFANRFAKGIGEL